MAGMVWFLLHIPGQTRSSLWVTHVGNVWVLAIGAATSSHLPETAWCSSTLPTQPWTDHSRWRAHVWSILLGCSLSHTGGCHGWSGWT